ncbi:MAG: T9SS type A sorting domain-containing protein [Bacteroidaceae bacterium]|nr:T9SS type A sorting domain-containing protein [Bacteroidaceae bacterium]
MKKLLFTAALSTATFISASGQEVASFDNIDITPSCVTSNGKAVPIGFDYNDGNTTVTILDSDFKVVKQINTKSVTQESRSYSEIATVKPTGATIRGSEILDYTIDGETITATDLNSMIQKMSSIQGCDFYGFTDSKGRLSCWSPQWSRFYYQEWLGTMYPENYFAIIDGKVSEIRISYEPVFDIDHAQWTPLEADYYDHTGVVNRESFYFYDFDTNTLYDNIISFTQTLFNEDDKWEYILPQLGPIEKYPGDYWVWDRNANGLVLRRNVSEAQPTIGYTIYSEDGNTVASFQSNEYQDISNLDCIYKLGGNIYFDCHSTIYKYTPLSTSIKEVNRSEAKTPFIKMRGRNIIVEDSQKADEAVLVDMGGRIVATSNRKGNESITINAANMPAGVYNVAVKNKGRLATAQKIILK